MINTCIGNLKKGIRKAKLKKKNLKTAKNMTFNCAD